MIFENTVNDKVKREKSFAVHWISFKCRKNFCGFYFNHVESAKESHCSTEHVEKNFVSYQKSVKSMKLFSHLTCHLRYIPNILFTTCIET